MAGPTKKFFGSLSLDGIKQAVLEVPAKVDNSEKYGKQLKVSAAQWDDGGISINLWDADNKREIKLGNLRVSQFDAAPQQQQSISTPQEGDLPF